MPTGKKIDLAAATARARHIRGLYKQLEERLHGNAWTTQEVMIGYLYDIGQLGRLIMAAEERWLHESHGSWRTSSRSASCGFGPCRSLGRRHQ